MRMLTLAVLAFPFAIGAVRAAAAETVWDLPANYAAGSFHTRNLIAFAADVEKATGGALRIKVHPGGTLFKHAEIKPAVRDGRAPIGEILESLVSNEAPVYGIDSVPFLATGYDQAKKLYAAQKPFLEKQLAAEGLMLLYSVPWPPQGIYAKREITSVDDLKGLKFRTYNAAIARVATLVGAVPTQIEVPDLPAAFDSGRVDVMITSASSGVESKAENYLTHYIDTQAWLPRNIVFVNKAAFDKLAASEQEALRQAASAAETRGWAMSVEEMTIKTNALKAAKIIVLPASPDLKAGLAKIGETIAVEWEKAAGADGAAMLAAYRK